MLRCLGFSLCVFAFSAGAAAADLNFQNTGPTALCERLLSADLAGDYVVTNAKNLKSTLVHLKRLGVPNAYTLSTSILNFTRLGELQFERAEPGWELGDESGKRVNVVNVLTMKRDGDQLVFHFEDATELNGKSFVALPVNAPNGVTGNVNKPESFTMNFARLGADVRFTHLDLSPQLSAALSPSLKSLLATRVDSAGGQGELDFLLVTEMNRPMTVSEACRLLTTEYACSLDGEDPNARYYRFVVARSLYSLLENIGLWIRQPDFARVDAFPNQVLSPRVGQRIADRIRSLGPKAETASSLAPTTPPPAAAPAAATVTVSRPPPPPPQPLPQRPPLGEPTKPIKE